MFVWSVCSLGFSPPPALNKLSIGAHASHPGTWEGEARAARVDGNVTLSLTQTPKEKERAVTLFAGALLSTDCKMWQADGVLQVRSTPKNFNLQVSFGGK